MTQREGAPRLSPEMPLGDRFPKVDSRAARVGRVASARFGTVCSGPSGGHVVATVAHLGIRSLSAGKQVGRFELALSFARTRPRRAR